MTPPRKLIAAFTFAGIFATAAHAEPIEDRQKKMKTVGESIGVLVKMAKGQTEFDGDVALWALQDMQTAAEGFETLFPAGTETGGETEAAPAIFTDRAGFEARQAAFEETLAKVTGAAPADLNALRATLGEVGGNCSECHKAYRVKKN